MPKSIANLELIQQTSRVLASARRDARDSAENYRASLGVQWTATYTADQTRRQGTALVALLDKIAANATAIQTAATEWDVDYPALQASYGQIRQAAIAMRDTLADGSNVQSVLDQIIAGLPRGTVLF